MSPGRDHAAAAEDRSGFAGGGLVLVAAVSRSKPALLFIGKAGWGKC